MHASVYDFVTRVLGRDEVEGRRILEVGSLDVNGSVRPYVTSLRPAEYVGVDRRRGRRVDVVARAEQLPGMYGKESFDVVICTETLEHMSDWRVSLWGMAAVLRIGGLLVLTTRSPGFPRHDHPADYWRFSVTNMHMLFHVWDLGYIGTDSDAPGVFIVARKSRDLPIAHFDTIHATRAPL